MTGSRSWNGSGTTRTHMPAFKVVPVVYHDRYLPSLPGTPHAVIVHFPDVPEPVLPEVPAGKGEKCDLEGQDRILKLPRLPGNADCIFPGNADMILPVQVKAADLAPVHVPRFIRLPVEHVRVDPADCRPSLIDPAPTLLEKNAGAGSIALRTGRIPCSIECSVLVAEIIGRDRLEGEGIRLPDPVDILLEQQDMAVKNPGTAPSAEVTGEAHLPDDCTELFFGIVPQFFPLTEPGVREGAEGAGERGIPALHMVSLELDLWHSKCGGAPKGRPGARITDSSGGTLLNVNARKK